MSGNGTTPRRKHLSAADLGTTVREAIAAEVARRPTWTTGLVLGCSRCLVACVGGARCRCCEVYKRRDPGGGLIYPPYASGSAEPGHYAICRVSEVAEIKRAPA